MPKFYGLMAASGKHWGICSSARPFICGGAEMWKKAKSEKQAFGESCFQAGCLEAVTYVLDMVQAELSPQTVAKLHRLKAGIQSDMHDATEDLARFGTTVERTKPHPK